MREACTLDLRKDRTMTTALPHPSRRGILAALAGTAAGTLTVRQAFAAATPERIATILPSNVCILTPQAVEGPYYFDASLVRSDVTEGRPGIPMKLMLQVIEASTCEPIPGARVDIWHCDATGLYSGYSGQGDDRTTSTEGEKFLRGTQTTDDSGIATFGTIYPGWYRGRTTHIHFKVFLDEKTVMMSQIYFPDALSTYIYENIAPYDERASARDTINKTDDVLAQSGGGHGSFCSIKEDADSYLASLVIGVDRQADIAGGNQGPGGPGGPPPGGTGGLPPPPGGSGTPPAPADMVPGAKG
jgi:protocatechuate 3,4-dioxygenase beta subunit